MDPDEFVTLTLPGTPSSPDRLVYVRLDAIAAVEALEPYSGAASVRVHLTSGTVWAVREVPSDLFEELP